MGGRKADAADLVRGERAHDFRRNAHDQRAGRDLASLGDDRSRRDQAIVTDAGAVEDDRPHADEHVVADRAAVQDGAMADGAALADRDRAAGVGVHHAEVLDVGVAADDDRLAVSADDRTEPDADPLREVDPADHRRIGSNPELAFARQARQPVVERIAGHWPLPSGKAVAQRQDQFEHEQAKATAP